MTPLGIPTSDRLSVHRPPVEQVVTPLGIPASLSVVPPSSSDKSVRSFVCPSVMSGGATIFSQIDSHERLLAHCGQSFRVPTMNLREKVFATDEEARMVEWGLF